MSYVFYAGVALGLLAAVQSIALRATGLGGRLAYLGAAVFATGSFYLLFGAGWYYAPTIEEATAALRHQTAAALLYTLLFSWLIGMRAGVSRARPYLAAISVVVLGLLLCNYLFPFGLRYESLRTLPPLVADGYTGVPDFIGAHSSLVVLLYALFFAAYGWSFWCCLQLYARAARSDAHVYAIHLVLQCLVLILGLLAGYGVIESLFLSGIAFVWLAAASIVQMLRELAQYGARLQAESEQRISAQEQLRDIALVDRLTGLANSHGLMEQFESTVKVIRGKHDTPMLILVGVDSLAEINHCFGYMSGNALLCNIAEQLKRRVWGRGVAARTSGGEFALLYGASHLEVAAIREGVHSPAVSVLPWLESSATVGEQKVHLRVSTGAALIAPDESDFFEVLHKAELAREAARRKGSPGMVLFDTDLARRIQHEQSLVNDLREALEADSPELLLHFQPKVSAGGDIVGAEALLRWEHPRFGNLSPEVTIPLAERSALIGALGQWVLRRSCSTLARWRASGEPFAGRLAVNVSGWQLHSADIVDHIEQLLTQYGLPGAVLELEVAESALGGDHGAKVSQVMGWLRAAGVNVTLDNFGAGNLSLAHLHRMRVDSLKIDKSLIRQLDHSAGAVGAKLVNGIVDLARTQGVHVAAEGVETDRQRQLLEAMGCRQFQGYLLCRPLPEADFLKWLAMRGAARTAPHASARKRMPRKH